jgi:hypothetical protein
VVPTPNPVEPQHHPGDQGADSHDDKTGCDSTTDACFPLLAHDGEFFLLSGTVECRSSISRHAGHGLPPKVFRLINERRVFDGMSSAGVVVLVGKHAGEPETAVGAAG